MKNLILLTFFITSLSLSAKVDTIPFTQLPTGQLVIEAKISGLEDPQLFILETGGNNLFRKDMNYRLQALGIDTTYRKIKFKSITIGNTTFERATTFTYRSKLQKRSAYAFPPPVLGTIGPEMFSKKCMQIDYQNKEIRLADNIDELHIPDNTPKAPFTQSFINQNPVIEIEPQEFGRQQIAIEVSAPMGITLSWDQVTTEARTRYYQDFKTMEVWLDDQTQITLAEKISLMTFFDNVLVGYNVPITFTDDYMPLIGNQFLQKFLTTIDFNKGLLYLDPITEESKAYFVNPKEDKKSNKKKK